MNSKRILNPKPAEQFKISLCEECAAFTPFNPGNLCRGEDGAVYFSETDRPYWMDGDEWHRVAKHRPDIAGLDWKLKLEYSPAMEFWKECNEGPSELMPHA